MNVSFLFYFNIYINYFMGKYNEEVKVFSKEEKEKRMLSVYPSMQMPRILYLFFNIWPTHNKTFPYYIINKDCWSKS